MTGANSPRLVFDYEYTEAFAYEAWARGQCGAVSVEMSDGRRYPVYFYDAERLAQDLEEETKLGRPFLAEKGLIVLSEVTLENMQKAVEFLASQGFFA